MHVGVTPVSVKPVASIRRYNIFVITTIAVLTLGLDVPIKALKKFITFLFAQTISVIRVISKQEFAVFIGQILTLSRVITLNKILTALFSQRFSSIRAISGSFTIVWIQSIQTFYSKAINKIYTAFANSIVNYYVIKTSNIGFTINAEQTISYVISFSKHIVILIAYQLLAFKNLNKTALIANISQTVTRFITTNKRLIASISQVILRLQTTNKRLIASISQVILRLQTTNKFVRIYINSRYSAIKAISTTIRFYVSQILYKIFISNKIFTLLNSQVITNTRTITHKIIVNISQLISKSVEINKKLILQIALYLDIVVNINKIFNAVIGQYLSINKNVEKIIEISHVMLLSSLRAMSLSFIMLQNQSFVIRKAIVKISEILTNVTTRIINKINRLIIVPIIQSILHTNIIAKLFSNYIGNEVLVSNIKSYLRTFRIFANQIITVPYRSISKTFITRISNVLHYRTLVSKILTASINQEVFIYRAIRHSISIAIGQIVSIIHLIARIISIRVGNRLLRFKAANKFIHIVQNNVLRLLSGANKMFVFSKILRTSFSKSVKKAFRIPINNVMNFDAIKTAYRSFIITFNDTFSILKNVNKSFSTIVYTELQFNRQKAYNVIATFTLSMVNQFVRVFSKMFNIWLEPALRFAKIKTISDIIYIIAKMGKSAIDFISAIKVAVTDRINARLLNSDDS